ncbi:hypothetical protein [Agrobacterium tumefaciens]|uniref:hypothetical protein n=1 Tax=Agrobacterium tumefaciens TaxID=358 RepID=UPI0015740DFF|nr:hypothetical protein [Agrobacterium tumefaciens]
MAKAAISTEEFIRQSAAGGLSRRATCEALGVCRKAFAAMLEAMEPIQWPGCNQSVDWKLSAEARRGHCPPKLMDHLKQMHAKRRQAALKEVRGVVGSTEQLAAHFGVSYGTVRRRLKSGWSLETALTTPPTPLALRRDGYGTAARPGMEVAPL